MKPAPKDISLEMLSTLATRIKDGAVNQKGLFDSVVGKIPGRERRWVVDIDNISAKYLLEVLNVINTIKPVGDKVLKVLPTKMDGTQLLLDLILENFQKDFSN